ncbi:hypothetical protein GTY65_15250 [Streptomyces sp. SID8379]|uniref:lipoprotein n=1 Tax=unclassified Streptomyces TaxID=2593676 RepID=UPI0005B8CE96|nr:MULTISPECIES: lipoprotein [unclassified Streptomyces]MYW65405.1 hypothetical protein [Streptomyces sp. SID8379]
MSQARPGPRRRSLLVSLAGAALLTGCSDGGDDAGAEGAPSVSQDKRLRTRQARESADLLGRYDEALAAQPSLEARLAPLRDEVERHVKAFGGATRPRKSGTTPSTPPVAEKDVLKALAAAERELSDRRMKALVEAPAELARLLASVAAAGAGHAFLLGEG